MDRGGVIIGFADTGTGVDPALADKILQPFVTSKKDGSGLGLFVVNQIVQAHGGTMNFRSEPGVGTSVTVSLPAHYSKQVNKGPLNG